MHSITPFNVDHSKITLRVKLRLLVVHKFLMINKNSVSYKRCNNINKKWYGIIKHLGKLII